MIYVGRIIERGEKDTEDAHGRNGDAYRRNHPVYRRVACEPEPENPDRHQRRLDTGERKSSFGRAVDFDRVMFHGVVFLIDGEDSGDDGADADGSEYGAGLFQGEPMVDLVH